MNPQIAVIGSSTAPKILLVRQLGEPDTVRKDIKTRSTFALVLLRSTVALVLLALPAALLHPQEPQQWPQDDPPTEQAPGYAQPQYAQPQQGYPQLYSPPNPQQGYYSQPASQPYTQQPDYGQQPGYAQAQGMNAEQLEQLVAPIALYPDALLAQILAASTYPAQIAAADQWLRGMGNAPPEQVAAAANAQTGWDPSVKALTAYPQVLSMMNQNLQWTTSLGNAYYNQPQDLLQTVQVLRQRAESAGNLQSSPQEGVTNNQGYIALAPPNPEVVNVPTYDPWAVYGQPITPYPDYSPLDAFGSVVGAGLQYGLSFAVSPFLSTPFGLLSWGLDWLGSAILFNHDPWCSNSYSVADWGFPHGGPRAFRGGEYARYGDRNGHGWNSNGNQQGFNRGGGRYPVARPGQGFVGSNRYGDNRGTNFPTARPGQSFQGREWGGTTRGNPGYSSQTHPAMPQQYALNHLPPPVAHPQPYQGSPQSFGNRGQSYGYGSQSYAPRPQPYSNNGQRPSFGSGYDPRPMQNYGRGHSLGYGAPSQTYRAPTPSFGGHGYSQPPSNSFAGSYGNHSGGFHLFGGGHNNAPSYGGSHSFGGGGHSFGGSSHSFGGGGHSFGGGGGHSFGGGGHSFGGGHSGGGHSGGGHSGGGGHDHHH
jgi:Protein of unknown function (DUF3300)